MFDQIFFVTRQKEGKKGVEGDENAVKEGGESALMFRCFKMKKGGGGKSGGEEDGNVSKRAVLIGEFRPIRVGGEKKKGRKKQQEKKGEPSSREYGIALMERGIGEKRRRMLFFCWTVRLA